MLVACIYLRLVLDACGLSLATSGCGCLVLEARTRSRAAIDLVSPSLVRQLSANDPVLFPKEFFLNIGA